MLKIMIKDRAKHTPKAGYNLVGVDDYETPGEQLYLIGHFNTEAEANRALTAFKKENPGETAYVYGPK